MFLVFFIERTASVLRQKPGYVIAFETIRCRTGYKRIYRDLQCIMYRIEH